jgi:hypothetical protein
MPYCTEWQPVQHQQNSFACRYVLPGKKIISFAPVFSALWQMPVIYAAAPVTYPSPPPA